MQTLNDLCPAVRVTVRSHGPENEQIIYDRITLMGIDHDKKQCQRDQPSGGETTWTNTGPTRSGRGQQKTG